MYGAFEGSLIQLPDVERHQPLGTVALLIVAEKVILNLVKLHQILIAITLLRLILQVTEFRLVPNYWQKRNYNPNLV